MRLSAEGQLLCLAGLRARLRRAGGRLPAYLKRENFAALQAHAGRAEVLNTSFTDYLRCQADASADRYVLLDAQDWMTDAQLNDLWTEITRTARPGARVIFRTAAEPSLLPGRVGDEILAGTTAPKPRAPSRCRTGRRSMAVSISMCRG